MAKLTDEAKSISPRDREVEPMKHEFKEGDVINYYVYGKFWGVIILGEEDGHGYFDYVSKKPDDEWRDAGKGNKYTWNVRHTAANDERKVRLHPNPDEVLADYAAWRLIHG
jgi:hypothetical protein